MDARPAYQVSSARLVSHVERVLHAVAEATDDLAHALVDLQLLPDKTSMTARSGGTGEQLIEHVNDGP